MVTAEKENTESVFTYTASGQRYTKAVTAAVTATDAESSVITATTAIIPAAGWNLNSAPLQTHKTTITCYVYDGYGVLFETDIAGTVTALNHRGTNLYARTSYPGSGGTGNITAYYLYNAHGDVEELIDAATGTTLASYTYDAFGTQLKAEETDTFKNTVTYRGYEFDADTGLYYLNARYYDSETARFLTEDTYRGEKLDPLSLNLYAYCAGNPMKYADPSGHEIKGGTYTNSKGEKKNILFYSISGVTYTFGFRVGDTAKEIEQINTTLKNLEYLSLDDYKANRPEFFSEATEKALRVFQRDYGIASCGICEQLTFEIIQFLYCNQAWRVNPATHQPIYKTCSDRIEKIKATFVFNSSALSSVWKRPSFGLVDLYENEKQKENIRKKAAVCVCRAFDGIGVPFTGTIADIIDGSPWYETLLDVIGDAGVVTSLLASAGDAGYDAYKLSKLADDVDDCHDAAKVADTADDIHDAGKAVGKGGSDTTRVGRWMSQEEYDKMLSTGKVQMSGDNKVHVANPADINAFGKQAPNGSLYVEFDVPSNTISKGGTDGWGIINGPGSLLDRLNAKKGLPRITEMPNATNIIIRGKK